MTHFYSSIENTVPFSSLCMIVAASGSMERFDFALLENQVLDCEECGWRGRGFETDKGFGTLPASIEICCPVCGHYFGEVKREEEEGVRPV